MREIVDPNFHVDIDYARLPQAVGAYLPGAYDIDVNQGVHVAVLPWLPSTGWPDPLPIDEEDVANRDDAAWLAAGLADIAVVPSPDGTERIETITRTDVDGAVNVIVWLPAHRHALLARELRARLETPVDDAVAGPRTRLSNLSGSELGRFFKEVLPRAVVDPYQRRVLVLDRQD